MVRLLNLDGLKQEGSYHKTAQMGGFMMETAHSKIEPLDEYYFI
jgi:hypothetical protein